MNMWHCFDTIQIEVAATSSSVFVYMSVWWVYGPFYTFVVSIRQGKKQRERQSVKVKASEKKKEIEIEIEH